MMMAARVFSIPLMQIEAGKSHFLIQVGEVGNLSYRTTEHSSKKITEELNTTQLIPIAAPK